MAKVYRFSFYVPYAHVDQMKVVYYANYLMYFEMARSSLLREAGISYTEMEAQGVMLPVVEAHCEYHQPARYDDQLTILSTCQPFKGPRLRISYEVLRAETLLATGYTHHVCMRPDGKVLRPTAALRALCGTTHQIPFDTHVERRGREDSKQRDSGGFPGEKQEDGGGEDPSILDPLDFTAAGGRRRGIRGAA